MACPRLLLLATIFGSYYIQSSAITPNSTFLVSDHITTWINNPESVTQETKFRDGSMVRFILVAKEIGVPGFPFDSHFAFGFGFYFNTPSTNTCYLSIIYTAIFNSEIQDNPPKVVWTANRDNPVGENATLSFTHKGNLILSNTNGITVWSTNTSDKYVVGMNMTSEGNLVLFDQTSGTVWQSFEHPTDTMVPGQILRRGQRLTSSISPMNMSQGLFYISIEEGYLSSYMKGEKPTRYLTSKTRGVEPLSMRLMFIKFTESSVNFYYLSKDNETVIKPFGIPDASAAQILKFDADGGLKVFSCLSENGWSDIYAFVDGWDECRFPLKCGRYGLCLNGQCMCPVGADGVEYFQQINSNSPYLGCMPVSTSASSCYQEDQLIDFGHLSYFSYFSDDTNSKVLGNEESCKQTCTQNASCRAAFFKQEDGDSKGYCYLPSDVLTIMTTPMSSNYYSSSYIKVSIPCQKVDTLFGSVLVRLTIVATVVAALILIILCKIKRREWKNQECLQHVSDITMTFSYSELCTATAKFSRRLGEGGFGTVFKGELKDETLVAVKRLENIGQGTKEFIAEIDTIGNIHHINLVRLIGVCVEKRHRLLVYEYMSNGSLDKWIFSEDNDSSLDWRTRKKIVKDIAKGLAYLHEECRYKIAHLDVKPHNILLDENFNAKLSDFGMSKLIRREKSQVTTRVRGTLGYLAPEWLHSRITVKADIYSFGIVLLELVSGRKILDYNQPESEVHLLSLLQNKFLDQNQLMDIVDSQCEDMLQHKEEATDMIRLGICCLNSDYTKRPPMSIVVKILEGEMVLEPKSIYNFLSIRVPATSSSFP